MRIMKTRFLFTIALACVHTGYVPMCTHYVSTKTKEALQHTSYNL